MNNLLNKIKGILNQASQTTESKNKEEEDPLTNSLNYNFSMKERTTTSNKSFNVNDLESIIVKNISSYKIGLREIDFIYESIKGSENDGADDETKMKLIGKIYMTPITKLNEFFGNYKLQFNQNILEAGSSNFPTAKSKNCVFKGKWVYEVLLLTNGLFQIGWVS